MKEIVGIKVEGAKSGELDLVSIGKFGVALVSFVLSFYALNQTVVNDLLKQYISNPQVLAVVIPMILYISEEWRKDYSDKNTLEPKKL